MPSDIGTLWVRKTFPAGEEDGPKALAAAREAGFDGAEGDAGDGGDLVVLEAVDIGEEDDVALVLGEFAEGSFEGRGKGAVVEGGSGVGGGVGGVDGRFVGVVGGKGASREAAPSAAQFVAGVVEGDAKEPATEATAAELGDGAVGGEEGFLGGVFGGRSLAELAVAEGEHEGLITVDEAVEGVETAVFCQRDQVLVGGVERVGHVGRG